MSALAEFLKGKVDESLTKLLQPAGLAPATLFVLLNLAFVYPALKSDGVAFAQSFSDLGETWQVVVVAVLILLLGYLLLSAASNVLDLLAGESWRGSWLYERLKSRAQNHVKQMAVAAFPEPGSVEALADWWDLRVSYPVRDLGPGTKPGELTPEQLKDVGPTALGNVLRASQQVIYERYGIDPVALWPQMEVVVDKDSAAKNAATDAKASLDTLANVSFVLGAFAVEGIVLHSARSAWSAVLLSALAIPAAYVAYRATVAKARGWGDVMEVICDLYREKLHEQLELRKYTSPADERDLWKKTSTIFLWGSDAVDKADDVYEKEAPAAKSAAITASKNLLLVRHEEQEVDMPDENAPPGEIQGRYVDHTLMVTRTPRFGSNGIVAVTDPRVPRLVEPPKLFVFPGDIIPTPAGRLAGRDEESKDTAVWQLAGLPLGASVLLSFTLPIWELRVGPKLVLEVERRGTRLSYAVKVRKATRNTPKASRWLEVFVAETTMTPSLLRQVNGQARSESLPSTVLDGRYRFDLSEVAFPAELSLSFS